MKIYKRLTAVLLAVALIFPYILIKNPITTHAYSGGGYYDDPYIVTDGILSDTTVGLNTKTNIYPKLTSSYYDTFLDDYGYDPVIEEITVSDMSRLDYNFYNFYATFTDGYDSIEICSFGYTGQVTLSVLYYYYFDSYGAVYFRTECTVTIEDGSSAGTDPGYDPGYNPGYEEPGYNYYSSDVLENISIAAGKSFDIDLSEEIETSGTGDVDPVIEYTVYDETVAEVTDISADGLRATVKGIVSGNTSLSVKYTYDHGDSVDVYTSYAYIYVTEPGLSAGSAMVNIHGNDPYGDGMSAYSMDVGVRLTGLSNYSNIEYKCKNKKIELSFYRDYSEDGAYKIYLIYTGKKKGTFNVKITADGKALNLKLKFYEMYLKYNSKSINLGVKYKDPVKDWDAFCTNLILAKGDTTDIKLVGKPSGMKAKWESSNKKVATVNNKGKVKARGYGDATITVTVGESTLFYYMSVTTKTCSEVLYYAAKHYGDTYSQEKRMSEGCYDCSSYAWRSYAAAGKKLGGVTSWAPTAADLCKWCAENDYVLDEDAELRAGDLAFETGADNGRYLGIYHVDLYAGNGWFFSVDHAKGYEYEPVFARPYK